ncbi:hypothetical protein [Corynebacterium sp. A21]|uniref:hypothetical protein n=1 Tax=Corynebacterium sp. A21 TaxID=3457318 RepID=UPI003FD5A375
MIASRMIPMIWFRLIVLIAFAAFVSWEGTWWAVGITVLLMAMTIWQLSVAYREKRASEQQ